ncbi:putative transcriptional regulatory protein [Candidatus Kuenenia stuttgartiensis]|uniref:Probable transcriptional regulatory protein KsCSTR_14870 n=1 Tax=Kuenenia stuttgartiensis TaxID=174633 RepID=Q1Q1F4_KUEST|nr:MULTISPECIES: YebC/PmpR family DNA-binding transcriptional regulator [Kuenenia]MBW7941542.1 YebC/PmpR family DNA-binding transcriptional regulator [Candidatus Kuenenia stuttgartiensis]MBZ0191843.1 YebC/PmpR family DNA-binding transcriptional regulator [Candidatus Kuenenia stuttgartiensis]MCF6153050.1 YebC/PmpR family DNA-binding transcriptional regulator [Candidatus Kuenenia stuttgartiensis]MCL4725969.1 YebC/PmpR family DNA-binding transcriptional regulator [Candidatus Kuenenia stuttgartiens
MAGHSHWAGIKHKKSIADAKRGKVFSKISRMITIAVKKGGSDPNMNPKLELAISKARMANMPKDNIERAIQKGIGTGGDNIELQECLFEGYGPNGIAIMMDALTDNKNRTVPELRKLFEKFGGNMGETGCVSWMFEKKGIILVNNNVCVEDEFMMLVLDAGAEDLQTVREYYQVLCAQTDLDAVKKAIETQNITIENAETSWLANNTIEVEGEAYRKALQLIEALEDHDDVNSVYSNLNFAQEFFEAEK